MARLLLVGARQARPAGAADRDHGALYDEGRVLELDPTSGAGGVRLRWAAVHPWSPPGAGHAFKGASWDGRELLLCRERELLWVDPATWGVRGTFTHPWFNDVHHAVRLGGRLVVASTGIDCALVFRDADEDHLDGREPSGYAGFPASSSPRAHPLTSAAPPKEGVDFRPLDLRPHRAHPNHVFSAFGRTWVSRAHQRDAVCLEDGARLEVGLERIHDGVLHDGRVWFTTVDGQVVAVDQRGRRQVIGLHRQGEGPLGWCRGLCHVDGLVWVGFTRLRATRFRSHLAWMRGQLRGAVHVTERPTRLVGVDPVRSEVCAEIDLEALGLDAVFGVLKAEG